MLRSIALTHFRNHRHFSKTFSKSGAIFVGKNGAGKTSILEAIFLLATLKSFRNARADIFVENGESIATIEAHTNEESFALRWQTFPQKKTVLRQNDVQKSAAQFLEEKKFFAVLFSPEDLQLPFCSPASRRRFCGRILFPLDAHLFLTARKFEVVLKNRNALLRRIGEGMAKRDELLFFNAEFSRLSEEITTARNHFFTHINSLATKFYAEISGTKEAFSLSFLPHTQIGTLLETLKKDTERDIARGTTSSGAHRDDFLFLLRGQNINEGGSRGEVRSAVLALKMAEKEFLQQKTGSTPVVLLDDVFSELDADRRKHLADFLHGSQVFLTATDFPRRALLGVDLPVIEVIV